jgi:hypothetical protein
LNFKVLSNLEHKLESNHSGSDVLVWLCLKAPFKAEALLISLGRLRLGRGLWEKVSYDVHVSLYTSTTLSTTASSSNKGNQHRQPTFSSHHTPGNCFMLFFALLIITYN